MAQVIPVSHHATTTMPSRPAARKSSVTLGQDLALNSLAAAILGGINFGNGRSGRLGPTVAALMLTFLFNVLTRLGLGEPGRLMLEGAIIAAALAYRLNQR